MTGALSRTIFLIFAALFTFSGNAKIPDIFNWAIRPGLVGGGGVSQKQMF